METNVHDIVIRNATIITMDGRRRIINDGGIAIRAGRIAQVAQTKDLVSCTGKTELDGRNKIVLPGLINPHVHLAHSLGRGCGDDLPFINWLPIVVRLEDAYADEQWYLSSLLTMVEMIKSGTTTFADTNIFEEIGVVVQAAKATGIRCVLGKNIRDEESEELERNPALRNVWRRDHPRSLSVEMAVENWREYSGAINGRIEVRLSPAIWPICSKRSYLEAADVGRRLGIGKLIHHTETKEWKAFVEKEYGSEPTRMLSDFGILGPDTLLENMAWLSNDEVDLLADSGTPINYLPTSNLKNFLGVLDIRQISDRGIPVSLGTSGGLINNINDMFREMFVLALQQRMLRREPNAIAVESILEMATVVGAQTLNLQDRVGSLETGKRADVIMIDTNRPHLVPIVNPVSTIVFGATGADVDTVIIDGNVVMKQRKMALIDESDLIETARREGIEVLKRTGISDQPQCKPRWPQV